MTEIHEEMSELSDKQVNVHNESLFWGSHKKYAMKMKERKNDCRVIFFCEGRTL